jgi:hypothetical protein
MLAASSVVVAGMVGIGHREGSQAFTTETTETVETAVL